MPASDIPEVRKGDKKWTFLSAKLANWVIKRLNALFRVTVKPDGIGKWDAGEEGIVLTINATPGGAGEVSRHAYQTYENGDLAVSIQFGMHGDEIVPTVAGISILEDPILLLPYATNFIYAKLSTNSSGVLDANDIDVYPSTQSNNDPNGDGTDADFYQLISAPVVSGGEITAINQNVNGSQAFQYCGGTMLFGLV